MKMTTRAIVIIAAALMILAGVGMAYAADGSLQRVLKAGKLTIGAEGNWVPYVYNDIKDNNKLKGFEVEVAEEIAKRLGVKAEFNISNKWDGVIAGLDAKRYDTVICGVTPNLDRQAKYNLSVAYAESPVCLVVAKDNKDINSFEDLKGKLAGNSLSSSSGNIARSYGAKLSDVSLTQAMDLLVTGRIDAHVNNLTSISEFLEQKPNTAVRIAAIYKPSASWEIEEAAMFRKEDLSLANAVNDIIKVMNSDGTNYKLAEKYFGKLVADGISIYKK
jgi:cystine transport system substrate-binding protein